MKNLRDFSYHNILVLGLAKSGEAAAKLLHESGKFVRVNDMKPEVDNPQAQNLKELGIDVITGSHPLSVLEGIDLVVKNPGIPYGNPIITEAELRSIPVITEVELAGKLSEGPIVAITGSNGKTTTTTLIHEMIVASGKKSQLAGNIGNVACEVARKTVKQDTLVLELSSFQLLGIQTFKPNIAVLLNLFEAHLDFHKTLSHYHMAKGKIFENQTKNEILIYNIDDHQVSELSKKAKSTRVPFSTKQPLTEGAWCDDSYIYFNGERIIKLEDIVLVGKHNVENILASVAAAKHSGATNEGITQVLTTFAGVKHRLQFVKALKGRKFYNDSKATNILATSKALAAFNQPTILLAGGLDRGNDFEELGTYLKNVKTMIVFGETASKLKETALKYGIESIFFVDNVEQATVKAYDVSDKNDVILLSPACASWDQYKTFEQRGDMFMDAVHRLD